MSYLFMSNINNLDEVTSLDKSYQEVGIYDSTKEESPENGVISFKKDDIQKEANFLMIRAHLDNDLLIQIHPFDYGVYIPAGELWSVDSIKEIDKFYIKNIISGTTSVSTGKIQWMIGYKQ